LIAGKQYSLVDLKHGILRGNKPYPGSFLLPFPLQEKDPRFVHIKQLQDKIDPRILFVTSTLREAYTRAITNVQMLEQVLREESARVASKCEVELEISKLRVPKRLFIYLYDFCPNGNKRDLISTLLRYLPENSLLRRHIHLIFPRQITVVFDIED